MIARTATLRHLTPRTMRHAAATAALLLAACKGEPASERKEPSAAAVVAVVATVDTATFEEIVDGTGYVRAQAGHAASLAAPAPTRVTGVLVTVGDRVAAGTALVQFERTAFDAAAESADAALLAAEQASARATRLVDAGVAPRKDAEAATAILAAARATALEARRIGSRATLRAPIAGIVTRVAATLGANVDVGETLVEIADPNHVDVLLQLSPQSAARVHAGQAVRLTDGASVDAASIGTGRVADIAAVVDSISRSVTVRVTVNGSTRPLRIGETVLGAITAQRHAGAVVIPDAAMVPFEEGFRVFVVDTANVAHARSITVGGRGLHTVWVESGLKAGERIVTTGAYGMDDGATVVSDSTARTVGKADTADTP